MPCRADDSQRWTSKAARRVSDPRPERSTASPSLSSTTRRSTDAAPGDRPPCKPQRKHANIHRGVHYPFRNGDACLRGARVKSRAFSRLGRRESLIHTHGTNGFDKTRPCTASSAFIAPATNRRVPLDTTRTSAPGRCCAEREPKLSVISVHDTCELLLRIRKTHHDRTKPVAINARKRMRWARQSGQGDDCDGAQHGVPVLVERRSGSRT